MKISEGASANSGPQSYSFGDFRVDASKRLLYRANRTPVPLPPKVFDTLLYLVQHSGVVLDKNRLMEAIWPDSVVEENNLNQNVSVLRRVLGERADSHRYIVTVPGHGYRFVADVSSAEALLTSDSAPVQPAHIIAVLPFKPLVATDADASLEMGMTDTLIAKLSGIRDVIVRPLGAVRKYTQLDLEPLIAGRDLGVGAVLDGSLQKSGDDIRVTVRLISVTSGGSIWAGTFEEKFTSIFALQDSISEKVVAALALRLSSEEKKQLTKRDTESTEAYQLYLKGRYFWWKGQPQEFRKSRDYFHRAVEVDPSYALGYCGLNSFYGFGSAWGMLPPEENWPKALAANARALELDETLVQAHTNQGAAHLVYHRDFAAAEREITYAIGLNPRFEESHYLYSFFLIIVGRFDEAIDEARRALELDPFSIRILQHLGDTFYYARRYDEAVAQYRIALELEPSNPALHESLGSVFKRKGQTAEAVAEWQTATKLGGDNELSAIFAPRSNSNGGLDRALRSVTKKKLERLTARDESGDYIPAIEYARAYVQLGETEQALKWLVKAADERDVFALLLGVDPFYDSLREDGRFTTILKRIGAPFAR